MSDQNKKDYYLSENVISLEKYIEHYLGLYYEYVDEEDLIHGFVLATPNVEEIYEYTDEEFLDELFGKEAANDNYSGEEQEDTEEVLEITLVLEEWFEEQEE